MNGIEIKEAKLIKRSYPQYQATGGRGYFSPSHAEYNAKPRIHFFVDGENILENLAFRHTRPTKLYREFLPQALKALGLPEDTRCIWSQKAGCSCGCSPAFIIQRESLRDEDGLPADGYVTLHSPDKIVAQTTGTPEAMDLAARRVQQLESQGILDALRASQPAGEESTQQSGRSGAGNLRNFKAMNDGKLLALYATLKAEANDDDAIDAVMDVMKDRNLL